MTATTDEIIAFIRARLAERADAAQFVIDLQRRFAPESEFTVVTYSWAVHTRHTSGGRGTTIERGCPTPGEVLRDIRVKNGILDRYVGLQKYAARPYDDHPNPSLRREYLHALDVVIREFASLWHDHPDYDPTWETRSS